MLSLQSARWSELRHAYGPAGNIPALLEQLRDLPACGGDSEPWFTLWSALAHQGDVYSATFAAVPHVVDALATDPANADDSYFHFPAWVEICRSKSRLEVPEDLSTPYFAALARLPSLVALAAQRPWAPQRLACALSAVAASMGHHVVAEAVLEMTTPDIAANFTRWATEQP